MGDHYCAKHDQPYPALGSCYECEKVDIPTPAPAEPKLPGPVEQVSAILSERSAYRDLLGHVLATITVNEKHIPAEMARWAKDWEAKMHAIDLRTIKPATGDTP